MKYNNLEVYRDKYVATEEGHIYSKYSNKLLREYTNRWGYRTVSLVNPNSGKRVTTFVHRYVAYCLVEGFEDGLQVNHIDGNKSNNVPSNLEWVSPKHNIQHAIKTLGTRDFNGVLNPRYGISLDGKTKRKISESLKGRRGGSIGGGIPVRGVCVKTGEEVYYENASLAGEALGIDNSGISKVIKGIRKTAGGYFWYVNLK